MQDTKEKKKLTEEEYQDVRTKLRKEINEMISSNWTQTQFGSLNEWMVLLKTIMGIIQKTYKIPGVQKSSLAIDVLQDIATIIIDENVANLNEEQLKTVKTVLSSEGFQLLSVSTSFLKQIISNIDTDGDGEISKEECHAFCCGCFSLKQ